MEIEAPALGEELFLDTHGRWMPFAPTYDAWFGRQRRRPNYARAAVEVLALEVVGTVHYWLQVDINRADWDRPNPIGRINFDAVRFDNNLFVTNQVLHPVGGGAFYWVSRANGLDAYRASLFALAGSATWEWLLEWREVVSINDLIFTPFGGIAMGEFFFQLGEYLNDAPPESSGVRRAAAMTLGAPSYVHRRLDDEAAPPELPPDSLGFSSAYWHKFRLGYQAAVADNDTGAEGLVHSAIAEGEIVALPGFQRPGHFGIAFRHGNFTDMRVRLTPSGAGVEDADAWFGSTLAGWYQQDFDAAPGGVTGTAMMVGFGVGLRYVDRDLLGRRDRYSFAHILGPVGTLWWSSGAVKLRLMSDVHFDFAAIQPQSFDEWAAQNGGTEGVKTSLSDQGYYFGPGVSARAHAQVVLGRASLDASAEAGTYDSMEGRDRRQEQVYRDVHTSDQILEVHASAGVDPEQAPLFVRVSAEQVHRRSDVAGVIASIRDRRIGLSVGLSF